MENASKALIIIGAILIALLLISAGVYVVNLMNSPQDQATDLVNSQSVEMHNSRFTGYAGEQRGSAVKQLVTAIQSTNAGSAEHPIVLDSASFKSTFGAIQAGVSNKKTYTVEFGYDKGYINSVKITENS